MSNEVYEQIIKDITRELGLDAETAGMFLNDYIAQLPAEISNLKSSIESNDFVTGASIAHSIKGVSGNLRIMPLHTLAAELEQALKNSQSDLVSEKMLQLEAFMTNLI